MAAGRRRAERVRPPHQRGRLLALALGVVAGVAAWVFLVGAAIDFGRAARSGDTGRWAMTVGAGLGAVLCLLLVFVLVIRVHDLLVRAHPRPRPARSRGGHRR